MAVKASRCADCDAFTRRCPASEGSESRHRFKGRLIQQAANTTTACNNSAPRAVRNATEKCSVRRWHYREVFGRSRRKSGSGAGIKTGVRKPPSFPSRLPNFLLHLPGSARQFAGAGTAEEIPICPICPPSPSQPVSAAVIVSLRFTQLRIDAQSSQQLQASTALVSCRQLTSIT